MITLYLFTFGFGALLIGASAVLGGMGEGVDSDLDVGADADLDADFDADADLDADVAADVDHAGDLVHAEGSIKQLGADAASWVPFLSLRFWSFGSAAFGATGLLLSLGPVPDLVTLPVSSVTGLGIGTAAAWFFRQLKGDVVTGSISLGHFVGEQATVVLAVRPGRTGTIRIETAGGDYVVPAVTHDKHDLAPGSTVLITSFDGRTADVTGIPVLEQHDGTTA